MTDTPKTTSDNANKPVIVPPAPAAPVKMPGDADKPAGTVVPAPPKS